MDLYQFGFKLYFLPNASLEPVTFTIGVSLSQDFIPPPNMSLVSALYYIKVSSELLRPVIMEIQHCINPDWVKNTTLTFVKADTDNSPPYVFEKLSGGRFGRNFWGAITLSNFSTVALFTDSTSVNYLAHLLTSHHKGSPGIYQVDLVISRKLNAIKEVIIIAIWLYYYSTVNKFIFS